ncbi:hypothetical protein ACQEVZ_09975 [Dactylosporangium sp. CA-152071]|uniref:hypothetical protein n=1 Tax=Dactylosporangium sp. CA-152071 TaxID=3239933 RepID=UPI003D8B46DF
MGARGDAGGWGLGDSAPVRTVVLGGWGLEVQHGRAVVGVGWCRKVRHGLAVMPPEGHSGEDGRSAVACAGVRLG